MRQFDLKDSRGETLVELLVTTCIITMVLFVVISIFIATRQASAAAWRSTTMSELSGSVMEQMQSIPYNTLLQLKHQYEDPNTHRTVELTLQSTHLPIQLDSNIPAASYLVGVSFATYQSYSDANLMAVQVTIHDSNHNTLYQKTDLVRNDDAP